MRIVKIKNLTAFLFFFLLALPVLSAKTVEYNIDIEHKTVNFTGKNVEAMTVGGTIPGKTIEANEGDILQVTFNNKMHMDTSIHWHGILLPPDQDGVPYLNTQPIYAGQSFTFRFPIIQNGTYWYHSHTMLQEQSGVYGALVFHPPGGQKKYDVASEYLVVLSDWTNENPDSVMRHLKADGDYYALKKKNVQSWDKVIKYKAVWRRLKQGWNRMGPMDLSDIGYDAFLMNGQPTTELGEAQKGQKILLRVINASSSSYFDVQFAGGAMQVVEADGLPVQPVETEKFRIAVAETYDVIVTIPDDKAFELRATSIDGTGYASGFVGQGEKVLAPDIPKPNPILMDHSMHMNHSQHAGHDMANMPSAMLDYGELRAPEKTTLPANRPVREVELRVTGNMRRYIWSFNNKTLNQEDVILIRRGENVRFILKNETMMNHPLHLHGHFFRVLNGQGEYSPLKHTVNVAPFETTIIEFEADKEKNWFFHCHILYHMMGGMARVVQYENTGGEPLLEDAQKNDEMFKDEWFGWGYVSAQSNMVDGFLRYANSKNQLELEWDNNYTGKYEVEPYYLRAVSTFLDVYVGGDFENKDEHPYENVATWGFRYVLPFFVTAWYRMDSRGAMRARFETEIQLTSRIRFSGEYEPQFNLKEAWNYSSFEMDHDYLVEFEYSFNKTFSILGNYGADYRGGGGARIRF